jgi:hypothetical protein
MCSCIFASTGREANAQGVMDALTFYAGPKGAPFGFVQSGGVGWSFIPTTDILVTSIEASEPQVSFWLGSNQVVATFGISNVNMFPVGSFTAITPLHLTAGNDYLVACQWSNSSDLVFFSIWNLPETGSALPFTASPYISYVGCYYVSTNGQWSSPTTPPEFNTNLLLYGPNFQFQLVPVLNISLFRNQINLMWATNYASAYNLQQNIDLATTNWVNYVGTVNTSDGSNSVIVTPTTESLFFRLQSP